MMSEVGGVEGPREDRRWENKMQDGSAWVPIRRLCLIISEEGYKWRWGRGVQERKEAMGTRSHRLAFTNLYSKQRLLSGRFADIVVHDAGVVNRSLSRMNSTRCFLCLHR